MKKIILLCTVLCLVFFNCGVSKEEHNKLEQELAMAKEENAKLQTAVSTFEKQLAISTEVRESIATANEKFMEVFNKGDAVGLANLYTENGQLLPPNSDFITGREGVQAFWQGAMDMGIKSAKLETIEVVTIGNGASEIGKYVLQGEGGKTLDTGKYVVIWSQMEGEWKLHRDIWNSSLPAATK